MSEDGRGRRVVSTSDRYAGGLRLNLASYLCSNKHVAKRSAAMLATKGSAAVTHKAAHSGFETQGRCHQKSKAGVSVDPQKGLMSSKKFFWKCQKTLVIYVVPLIPLFLTSVDVCSGFKKKSGCVLCHMCAMDTFECCTCWPLGVQLGSKSARDLYFFKQG